MFKRFVKVYIIGPIFIIAIILNILFWLTFIIWVPIYYVITGKDPMQEDILGIFLHIADKIEHFILDKL